MNLSRHVLTAFALMTLLDSSSALANPYLISSFKNQRAWNTVNPSNWSAVWSSGTWVASISAYAGGSVGKSYQWTAGSSGSNFASWTPAGSSVVDGEILIRMSFTNPAACTNSGPQVVLRATGTTTNRFGYYAKFQCTTVGQVHLTLAKSVNTSGSTGIASSSNFLPVTGTKYWIRFQVVGTTLNGKYWQDGTAEPGSWSVTATDSAVTAAGWLGYGNNAAAYSPLFVDFFSYVSGSGVAPGP